MPQVKSLHASNLPRLLYIGDVPVSASTAGAALLYRLLGFYPADHLVVCAPNPSSYATLPGVRYVVRDARWPRRVLTTRLAGIYCAWCYWRDRSIPRWLSRLVLEFRPQAILTVSNASSWTRASRLAQRERLPLYVIAHDDYAFSNRLPKSLQSKVNRDFASVYKSAAARFCISQGMADAYEQRYGVTGQVIYPTRDPANPVYTSAVRQTARAKTTLTFAYFGSIYTQDTARQIYTFAHEAARSGHRMVAYSPQYAVLQKLAQTSGENCHLEARSALPAATLLEKLREEADVLLLPVSFDPGQRSLASTPFPSKMADYSALGLPIIVWAPPYASIARFVREHPESAELVTDATPNALFSVIAMLASSPERRRMLGQNIIDIGRQFFSPEAAWEMFSMELCRRHWKDLAQ